MLTKEQFRFFVKDYCEFQKYSDKLAELNVNIWENTVFERFSISYVDMLGKLMGLNTDELEYNELDKVIYNYRSCTDNEIDNLYTKILSSKRYIPVQPKKEEKDPLLFNHVKKIHADDTKSSGDDFWTEFFSNLLKVNSTDS